MLDEEGLSLEKTYDNGISDVLECNLMRLYEKNDDILDIEQVKSILSCAVDLKNCNKLLSMIVSSFEKYSGQSGIEYKCLKLIYICLYYNHKAAFPAVKSFIYDIQKLLLGNLESTEDDLFSKICELIKIISNHVHNETVLQSPDLLGIETLDNFEADKGDSVGANTLDSVEILDSCNRNPPITSMHDAFELTNMPNLDCKLSINDRSIGTFDSVVSQDLNSGRFTNAPVVNATQSPITRDYSNGIFTDISKVSKQDSISVPDINRNRHINAPAVGTFESVNRQNCNYNGFVNESDTDVCDSVSVQYLEDKFRINGLSDNIRQHCQKSFDNQLDEKLSTDILESPTYVHSESDDLDLFDPFDPSTNVKRESEDSFDPFHNVHDGSDVGVSENLIDCPKVQNIGSPSTVSTGEISSPTTETKIIESVKEEHLQLHQKNVSVSAVDSASHKDNGSIRGNLCISCNDVVHAMSFLKSNECTVDIEKKEAHASTNISYKESEGQIVNSTSQSAERTNCNPLKAPVNGVLMTSNAIHHEATNIQDDFMPIICELRKRSRNSFDHTSTDNYLQACDEFYSTLVKKSPYRKSDSRFSISISKITRDDVLGSSLSDNKSPYPNTMPGNKSGNLVLSEQDSSHRGVNSLNETGNSPGIFAPDFSKAEQENVLRTASSPQELSVPLSLQPSSFATDLFETYDISYDFPKPAITNDERGVSRSTLEDLSDPDYLLNNFNKACAIPVDSAKAIHSNILVNDDMAIPVSFAEPGLTCAAISDSDDLDDSDANFKGKTELPEQNQVPDISPLACSNENIRSSMNTSQMPQQAKKGPFKIMRLNSSTLRDKDVTERFLFSTPKVDEASNLDFKADEIRVADLCGCKNKGLACPTCMNSYTSIETIASISSTGDESKKCVLGGFVPVSQNSKDNFAVSSFIPVSPPEIDCAKKTYINSSISTKDSEVFPPTRSGRFSIIRIPSS